MKNILAAIFIGAIALIVSGQEQAASPAPVKKTSLFFRYGRIIAAEACSTKPEIKDPTRTMRESRNSQYVQIIFQPDKGRSLSIHDFALADSSGKEYDCIAVAEGDKPYSGITWNFRDMDGTLPHRLLFAVPSAEGEFTLVFKLFPTKIKEKTFKLKSVSKLSLSGEIPDKGQLLLPDPPPPPPPPKAEEKPEEKSGDKDADKSGKDDGGNKEGNEGNKEGME